MNEEIAAIRKIPWRVLVVDDSIVVRQVLMMTLRQIPALLDATIDLANDGLEAFEKLKTERYDLVLTDINMPRLQGLELVRKIRNDLQNTTLPIILITTLGTEDDVSRGLAAGATAYMPKPLSPYRIRKLVLSLLARSRNS